MTTRNRKVLLNHVTVEFLLLNACILLTVILILPGAFNIPTTPIDLIQLILFLNIGWIIIIMSNGNSEFYFSYNFSKRLRYFILNVFLLVGLTYTFGKVFGIQYFDQPIILLPIFLFATFNLLFFQAIFRFLDHRNKGEIHSKALVLGKKEDQDALANFTEKIENSGYKVIGYSSETNQSADAIKFTEKVQEISRIHELSPIDEIFIKMESFDDAELKEAIKTADYLGIRVTLIPNDSYFKLGENNADLTEMPLVKVRSTPLDGLNNYVLKMVFDLIFAFLVLLLLSPILIIIALLIIADGKGGVFYTPHRKGLDGKTFKCYKFRTMSQNDDPVAGTKSTVKNDPRITKIGKFLRKYDIDEIPQFINVLKGDMSVVGPRPHRVFLQNDFRQVVNDYMVRHYVKPGLTGWAQVNGWRGPTTSDEQKKQRIKHDIYYIENWKLWFDIRIIFLTVFSRKARQNAF